MKYAVEMDSGAMIHIPSFIKIGSDIEFNPLKTKYVLSSI
jgi:hypothetical protein